MKLLYHVLLAACILAAASGRANAQIYKWVENGTVKYSDQPPGNRLQTYRVIGTRAPLEVTRPVDPRFAKSYDHLIEKYSATYDVSPDLVRAVVQVESGYNPRAVSRKGAAGLMQLMPATAIEMGVRNVFDPEENIRGGVAYLRQLLNRYGDDEKLALAAYNAGPDAVARHGNQVPPYKETQRYVSQVRVYQGSPDAGGRSARVVSDRPVAAPRKPAGTRRKLAAAVPAAGVKRAGAVYKWLEKTDDGRVIQKFSDTKPASGTYEIVR